jgi:hypothetical protein
MSSDSMISLAPGRDPSHRDGQRQTIQPLTRAQERFAKKNRAYPGGRSLADERMVFFYREGPMLAQRWLVGPNGYVIQRDSFAPTPQKHEEA